MAAVTIHQSWGLIVSMFSHLGLKRLLVAVGVVVLSACTTIDPYTGEQRIDYGATAGVAGLALGATALAVAANKDDDRRDTVVIDRRPVYGGSVYHPYRPSYRPTHPIHRPIRPHYGPYRPAAPSGNLRPARRPGR